MATPIVRFGLSGGASAPRRSPASKRSLSSSAHHDEAGMTTSTEEDPKRKSQPQLVKLSKALKLAEEWVNNMSKSSVDEKLSSVDLEGRPSRLGIGATVPKESRVTRSDNPVERKLLASLNATRKKAITNDVDFAKDGNNADADEESEEEESESKTRSFGKKRPQSFTSPFRPKKKLG